MSEYLDTWESRLHAFIDGELAEDDRAAVAAEIDANPELAQRVALYGDDKARLAATYGHITEAPIPRRWIDLIEGHARKPRRSVVMETFMALAASLLVLIGGSLVYRQMTPHEEPIVADALAARNNALPARQIIPVKASAETTVAGRALASALAMRVGVPDLTRMGYKLTGLRIYSNAQSGKAAELMYRRADGRTFALYLRHSSGTPRFDQYKQGNLRVCIWQDDVIGAVMTGEMSAAEMQRLASLAYMGLEA